MSSLLPEYLPPDHRSASLAAGIAPLVVLLSFTLLIVRWIDVAALFAIATTLALWVATALTRYQRELDDYNDSYVRRHLQWRSAPALTDLVHAPGVTEPTRDFVEHYLATDRVPDARPEVAR